MSKYGPNRGSSGVQSSLELEREQHNLEFRVIVSVHRFVRAGLPVQVFCVEASPSVQLARHPHDSIGDVREKQVRQQEWAKRVRSCLDIETIPSPRKRDVH